ncbi:MAG: M1 family aminopeptidase [Bernardetiaceae bacterium]
MRIYIEANQELYAVANGNLRSILMRSDDYTGYEWFVSYPINNYNVTVNLAHYRHFSEVLSSTGGQDIPLDYYVLDYNLDKAQEHFAQVKPMLECFEELFGAYPFPNDGYALVETPYWGMEHQGAIAYGNNYRNLEEWDFDFIIIHESGHEYFGNSLSVKDHGEMWIHEAFTTYAEALYLECTQDLATATDYLMMQRENIRNQVPILGPLHVNYDRWPDADMYYKGTWLLHTLRNILDDDQAWKKIIYDFHDQHRLQSIDTEEVIAFFERRFGMKLSPIFYQYLRHTQIPVLEYRTEQKGNKTKVFYRWQANEAGFEMPVRVRLGKSDDWQRLSPKVGVWQSFSVPGTAGELLLDERGFYAGLQKYSE